MAVIYGTPLFLSGGGGQNLTLPPMVTDLAASTGDQTITLTWTNPASDVLAGIAVVYNADHIPEKVSDGTKVDAGLSETVDLTGLTNETLYYIRVFPYNAKKQYQTLLNGATTSATPNIGPAQVTNFQVTGSGSSPVLTWVNPAEDPLYYQTVVVQKTDSAPTSLTDGTEIYRGTGTTVTASNLVRLEEYYFAVFTIDEAGSHRSPVVSEMYSYDFPEEPTEYTALTEFTSSNSYVIPEMGWFRIDVFGKCGNGSSSTWYSSGGACNGPSGGQGGYARSELGLNKNDVVNIDINSSGDVTVTVKEETIIANHGENGQHVSSSIGTYLGGSGGDSSGGNIYSNTGASGTNTSGYEASYPNKYPGPAGKDTTVTINNTQQWTHSSGDGSGIDASISWDTSEWKRTGPGYGSVAKVFISRGNTNVPSPSAASTLSLTPRNASVEASWTNSGYPESVGTILVSNSDHIPVHPTDGTSVDVAEATSYTITDLPNNKPSYISLFAYNADKTKYSAAKSDVEIPKEVTWYDVQEDLKEDIAETQKDAEQAQEVVLLTRDFLPDAVALTLPEIYDEWNPDGISYIGKDTATEDKPASIVRRNGFLYRCLQSHTSQENWTPENSPSLWVLIDDPAIEWPEWKQPTGAHDAYSLGAKVSHNGKKWISQIEANTVEPGTDDRYWKEYSE